MAANLSAAVLPFPADEIVLGFGFFAFLPKPNQPELELPSESESSRPESESKRVKPGNANDGHDQSEPASLT